MALDDWVLVFQGGDRGIQEEAGSDLIDWREVKQPFYSRLINHICLNGIYEALACRFRSAQPMQIFSLGVILLAANGLLQCKGF